jgi:hypothetical protein
MVDNLKQIKSLVIKPYSAQTDTLVIKSQSLKIPTINNLHFILPTGQFYASKGLLKNVPMPILFHNNVFVVNELLNDYIYYTGSIKDWAVSMVFTEATTNPLYATRKLFTNVTYVSDTLEVSTKEWTNRIEPYYIVEKQNDPDITYYKYLVNDYAFYKNH